MIERHNSARGASEWADTYGQLGMASPMQLTQLPMHILDPWEGTDGTAQPFKPYSQEKLNEMAESIRKNGVIEAICVRPKPDGRMEIIAGHNRVAAAKLAGLPTIPAIVQQLDDNQAAILLVDSNLQHREKLLPSEKAFAYKLRLDSMKRKAGRPKNNSAQIEPNFLGTRSNEQLADEAGESRAQIQRYIRLTYLLPSLLDMVDGGKPGFAAAVDLSFLTEMEQTMLLQVMEEESKVPGGAQAKALRSASAAGQLTDADAIRAILVPTPAPKPAVLKIPADRLQDFFPPNTSLDDMEREIYAALAAYRKNDTTLASD